MTLARIPHDIIEPADGDHPDLLLVQKGALVEILTDEYPLYYHVWAQLRSPLGRIGLNFGEYEPLEVEE